jgi:hypothetical protein
VHALLLADDPRVRLAHRYRDEVAQRRRGHGEDAIYLDPAKNRYVGAVSLGFGPDGKRLRRKVTGRTKQEVRDKLKALHAELDRGHPRASDQQLSC